MARGGGRGGKKRSAPRRGGGGGRGGRGGGRGGGGGGKRRKRDILDGAVGAISGLPLAPGSFGPSDGSHHRAQTHAGAHGSAHAARAPDHPMEAQLEEEEDDDEEEEEVDHRTSYEKLLGALGVGDDIDDDEDGDEDGDGDGDNDDVDNDEISEQGMDDDDDDDDQGASDSPSEESGMNDQGPDLSDDESDEGASAAGSSSDEDGGSSDGSSGDGVDAGETDLDTIRRTDPGFAGDGMGDFGESDSGSETSSAGSRRRRATAAAGSKVGNKAAGKKKGGKQQDQQTRGRKGASADGDGADAADVEDDDPDALGRPGSALAHLYRSVGDAEARAAEVARTGPLKHSWVSAALGAVHHDGGLPEDEVASRMRTTGDGGLLGLRRRLAAQVIAAAKERGVDVAADDADADADADADPERAVLSALDERERSLLALFASYRDAYLTTRGAAGGRADRFTRAYCIHALDHVLKTRDRVLKNRDRLRALGDAPPADDTPYRDRGYTRPTVLILVPFRNAALRVVRQLLELSPAAQHDRVMNKRKFLEEYGDDGERPKRWSILPRDHRRTFDGNTDDCFRLGISFSRKSVKLYADFYASDVIVASPLGLQLLTGTEADQDRGRGELDFLSSIELCVVDQCDAIAMQNMQHLSSVLAACNRIPRKDRGADITRLREWYIDGKSRLYRQTIMLGAYADPLVSRMLRARCGNTLGRAVVSPVAHPGVIARVSPGVTAQVFQRVECDSLRHSADARLEHFEKKVLPSLRSAVEARTLVFVSSYLDYTRLRALLRDQGSDFAPLCEYTEDGHLTRARGDLAKGKVDIALYTERLHYFRRFEIRGAKSVVFYQLPAHAHFYAEVASFVGTGGKCLAMFTRFDADRLEGVIGTDRAELLIDAEKSTHLFAK